MARMHQSVKNGLRIFSFLKMLGTAGINDEEQARDNLYRTVNDPANRNMIATGIEQQREHFDNLELHLGYVYGSTKTPAHASKYTPKFRPGARLPHAWITILSGQAQPELAPIDLSYVQELSNVELEAKQYSILDLCDYDGFTVLVGLGSRWRELAEQLRSDLAHLKIKILVFGQDFEFASQEHKKLYGTWDVFGSGHGLVVRPDQHIMSLLSNEVTLESIRGSFREHLGI
ncbi:hypothetical protein ANO11243_062120 [Dothideomycetidae sp. 11243]|nr:hypothetical protein ANO11243_062120 [fungal sp. No.11243]